MDRTMWCIVAGLVLAVVLAVVAITSLERGASECEARGGVSITDRYWVQYCVRPL